MTGLTRPRWCFATSQTVYQLLRLTNDEFHHPIAVSFGTWQNGLTHGKQAEKRFTKTNYRYFCGLKILGQFWVTTSKTAQRAVIRNIMGTTTKQDKNSYFYVVKYVTLRHVSHYESVGRGFESLPAYQRRIIRTLSQ